VHTLGAGDFLDFSRLVGLPPNGLRAIGLTNGVIRTIPAAQFVADLAASPAELARIGDQLSQRLIWVDRQLSYAATRTVRRRLLAQLRDVEGGAAPPSHASLASRVGASRETITRTLGQLEREGLISRERRRLRLEPADLGVAHGHRQQRQHRPRVHDTARDPHDQARELLVVNR
jgi:CRP-like cAMP-binding protein